MNIKQITLQIFIDLTHFMHTLWSIQLFSSIFWNLVLILNSEKFHDLTSTIYITSFWSMDFQIAMQDSIQIDEDLLANSYRSLETLVRVGTKLGLSTRKVSQTDLPDVRRCAIDDWKWAQLCMLFPTLFIVVLCIFCIFHIHLFTLILSLSHGGRKKKKKRQIWLILWIPIKLTSLCITTSLQCCLFLIFLVLETREKGH